MGFLWQKSSDNRWHLFEKFIYLSQEYHHIIYKGELHINANYTKTYL